jgi:hypothetical protein
VFGIAIFDETLRSGDAGVVGAWLGLVVAVLGVVRLATTPQAHS